MKVRLKLAAAFLSLTLLVSLSPGLLVPLASAQVAQKFQLDWDYSGTADGFRVYLKKADGSYTPLGPLGIGTKTFQYDANGPEGSNWCFAVTAFNASGESPKLEGCASIPATIPASATNLIGTIDAAKKVTLTWTKNSTNESGFKIYRNAAEAASVGAGVTTWSEIVPGAPGTAYSYEVAAFNSAGTAPRSNAVSVTVPVILPGAPSNMRVVAVTSTPPPPPPSGDQIALPLRTWVKQGPAYPYASVKHTAVAYNPDNGLIYLFGGDHNGSKPADPNLLGPPHQSGRNEAYTYNIATNTLTLIQQYCQPGLMNGGMDEVGLAYDSLRKKFWVFPGFQWDQQQYCQPTRTQMVRKVMTYAPGVGDYQTGPGSWTDPNVVLNPSAAMGNFTQYDPKTDSFIRFVPGGGCGVIAVIYYPAKNTWEIVQSGGAVGCLNDNWGDMGTTIDVTGRRMFVIGNLTGLIQYNIDAKTFQLRTPLAQLPDKVVDETKPIWDSVNGVLLWPVFHDNPECTGAASCQEQARIHAYNPAPNTWEANIASGLLPDGTRVKGRHAIFDPKQNALMMFGNVWNAPSPDGWFLFRYGNGG